MKFAPVIISRTRNVDYGPIFCLLEDLMASKLLTHLKNAVYGDDLLAIQNGPRQVKIVLSDDTHIIIGIVAIIKDILDDDTDLQLDDNMSNRTLWGFIGGAASIDEYRRQPKAVDLDNSFYKQAFMEMVYTPHWTEKTFKGPYPSLYTECPTVNVPEADCPFLEDEKIISSAKNAEALNYVLHAIHSGKNLSLATNAEYSSAKSISEGHIDYATVGMKRVDWMRASLRDKKRAAKIDAAHKIANFNVEDFQQKLSEFCKPYGMSCEFKKISEKGEITKGWFIPCPSDTTDEQVDTSPATLFKILSNLPLITLKSLSKIVKI